MRRPFAKVGMPLVIILLSFSAVLVIKRLLINHLDENDNQIIWFALAVGLTIATFGQIRKRIAAGKNKGSSITKRKERIERKSPKFGPRVVKVSEKEYHLPCSVCGDIAVSFKIGVPKFSETPALIYRGITHETSNVGNAKEIFGWLEEEKISEVHFHVMKYATMEEGIDAYCPDCDKVYCWSHYNPVEEWEDQWWYDCTYGTCPEGHKRIIHD